MARKDSGDPNNSAVTTIAPRRAPEHLRLEAAATAETLLVPEPLQLGVVVVVALVAIERRPRRRVLELVDCLEALETNAWTRQERARTHAPTRAPPPGRAVGALRVSCVTSLRARRWRRGGARRSVGRPKARVCAAERSNAHSRDDGSTGALLDRIWRWRVGENGSKMIQHSHHSPHHSFHQSPQTIARTTALTIARTKPRTAPRTIARTSAVIQPAPQPAPQPALQPVPHTLHHTPRTTARTSRSIDAESTGGVSTSISGAPNSPPPSSAPRCWPAAATAPLPLAAPPPSDGATRTSTPCGT